MERIKSALRGEICAFMIIYRLILLRIRNLAERGQIKYKPDVQ